MFKQGKKRPHAYGYEPTWEHIGPHYPNATRLHQRGREDEIYEILPGQAIPCWWPVHPGIGNRITHLLRTIDEYFGSDMHPPPRDVYGFYGEFPDIGAPNFLNRKSKAP